MDRLHILHLEDDAHDRELTQAMLQSDGLVCEYRYLDTREAFEAALLTDRFDVILADYNLPAFDGLTAHAIAKRLSPQTPFIFLSGTLGEELAVGLVKEGATDYVLKQRLTRLPSAVRRARREAEERTERQRAEAEVRRLNADLEQRVVARTLELAEANRALAARDEQLQKSEQWLEAILDFSPVAIYVKAVDGRYLLANQKTESILGYSPAALLGKTDTEVLAPRLAEMYAENDRRVMSERRPMRFEEAALHPDGIRVLASTKFPLYDRAGSLYALCGISEDVTDKKKAEDELKLARLEAQRASLAKSEFLSRMSHDLRTPLNAILGFAQVLDLTPLDAEQRDSIRQIMSGGRHLLELINEVLDISRIESGRLAMSLEPVSLDEVVSHAVELVKPLAVTRELTVVVEPGTSPSPTLWADRQRLTQILLNLLSNGVKYNRHGGSLTVGCVKVAPARHRIAVRDTGFGIPLEKLKLLFQPFERLGADMTNVEGTGLGLSLSRGLAEAMGGQLGVDTVVDEGSTFWVELPEAPAPHREAGKAVRVRAIESVGASRGTVLYIEDNAANVRLMERVLQQRTGVTLLHAGQGHVGVTMARERQPDLILLDMHLPDTSGDDVLRRLWEDSATRSIPVVVLTADATPGLVRRLTAAGAAGCFTKPLDIQQILSTLDQFLNRRLEQSVDAG